MLKTNILLCGVVVVASILASPAAAQLSREELAEIEAATRIIEPAATVYAGPRLLNQRPEDLLYFSDFEADDGGVTGSLDWEWGDYQWSPARLCFGAESHPPGAFSGTRMWATVLNDCYRNLNNNDDHESCTNLDPTDDSILSLTLDLTNETTAWISWAEWNDVFLPFDWVEIRANDNIIGQLCGSEFVEPEQWVENAIDISAVAGDVVTITLHMMASSVLNRAGLYIDDVAITRYDPRALFADDFESGDTSGWSAVQDGSK